MQEYFVEYHLFSMTDSLYIHHKLYTIVSLMHITSSQTLVEIISDTQADKKITVWPDVVFNYLVILRDDAKMNITIDSQYNSNTNLKVLCLGQEWHHIESTILTSLVENNAQANVYILSLLKNKSDISVHGSILLAKNVAKVSWHLLEENIILGDKVKIRTAPILDVHSSDVNASHWCRVEKIDPKKLFYMQSRGLDSAESQALILDGYLNNLFEGFEEQEELLKEIKTSIS